MKTIFQPAPTQWGLRGDPQLWKDLEDYFLRHPMSHGLTAKQFVNQLHEAMIALTAHSTTGGVDFSVEKYKSGGISSGMVSARFWEETAIPLLVERFQALYDL